MEDKKAIELLKKEPNNPKAIEHLYKKYALEVIKFITYKGANPEIAELPNWVIALVAAGALAAALSTAAGLLLVISASVSHDLIKKIINPKISEKNPRGGVVRAIPQIRDFLPPRRA